jgi:hypothetical protein
MPAFDGLLPEPHNKITLDVIFQASLWHGLAKLRMHTDSSLKRLDETTTTLGQALQRFESETCQAFETFESSSEIAARVIAQAKRARASGVAAGTGARRPKKFNLQTYKLHALGDYVPTIRKFGTTDSYTMQIVSSFLLFFIPIDF